ncbi:MAG TPA: hypothetical protein PLF61_04940, partial [Candidatus Goldiibacteriota bacterium]|nr:hypothetical protein [Candidatus Goldiibacteriota bacterium]
MNFQKRMIITLKGLFKNFNVVLLATTFLLIIIGAFSIFSATGGTINEIFIKQIIWYVIGLILMLIFANINYNNLIIIANQLYF